MSEFSPARLSSTLEELLDQRSSAQLCVAFSGGLDSVVLLNALVQLRDHDGRWKLRAVHVNHQLQPDSGEWAQQCEGWCQQLQVDCKVLTVSVKETQAQGLEAAARRARYSALQDELKPEEFLFTAHHADDQLETILIAMMRGAGLNGLAAMPTIARFGRAWHARPLLNFTRDSLQKWAHAKSLLYIDDPTNSHTHFDRNFLRHEIIARLKQRWPAAAVTGARAAHHLSDAKLLMDEYVAQDYSKACEANALVVDVLQQWPPLRRRAVIRYWLQQHDVLMPSTQTMHALEHDMLHSAVDRVPCTRWSGCAVHRFKGRLHLDTNHRSERVGDVLHWDPSQAISLPSGLGTLRLTEAANEADLAQSLDPGKLPSRLVVRFRQGGERIQLPHEDFHRQLKTLMQAANIFPWWRGRVPLIYAGDQLVAIAGMWVSADYVATGKQGAFQVQWLHEGFSMFSPV
jgi:tRNA(Ile)-lysidine synthase